MQDFDFEKSPRGEAYYRRADNMAVWDAHAGNFLNSGGVVVPIDVIYLLRQRMPVRDCRG